MRIKTLLIAAVFASNSVSASPSKDLHHFQLDNGLEVYVKQDHRAPVVVHQVWYKIGSTHELNGTTGIAHMLEHMMFKGTKTLESGEFSKRVSKMGGQENAFTSRDYTAYYQIVGKQHLKEVMVMESDRMRNLVVTDEDFYKERDVVAEERRWRTDDRPASKLYEQFMAMSFVNSPMHHPIIGWMDDIQNYKTEDARKWYQKWYAPNNAILVVVGDVEPNEVYELAKATYGQHAPEKLSKIKSQLEIPQTVQRRLIMKDSVESATVLMGFQVPTLTTAKAKEDVYALSVLSSVLDGDDSARLTKNLVRGSKVVASAGAGYDGKDRLRTLFLLEATPSKGKTIDQAESALWQEIEKLKSRPISQKELDRVLAHAEAQYVFHQDSTQAQAIILGSLVSVGLPADTLDNWIDNLRKVTPEQVQAVAQKYFDPDKVNVAQLLPNGKSPKVAGAKFSGRHAGGH